MRRYAGLFLFEGRSRRAPEINAPKSASSDARSARTDGSGANSRGQTQLTAQELDADHAARTAFQI